LSPSGHQKMLTAISSLSDLDSPRIDIVLHLHGAQKPNAWALNSQLWASPGGEHNPGYASLSKNSRSFFSHPSTGTHHHHQRVSSPASESPNCSAPRISENPALWQSRVHTHTKTHLVPDLARPGMLNVINIVVVVPSSSRRRAVLSN